MTDAESEDVEAAPREPTILLDEAVLLADAIRAETRSVAIRVVARKAGRDTIMRLRELLRSAPGACPVQLFIQMDDGAEAVLALRDLRVDPSDSMLAGLEKLFGEKVAELR